MEKKFKYAILTGLLLVVISALAFKSRQPYRQVEDGRTECLANLHKLGEILAKNAEEQEGERRGTYPPMSSEANRLMFTTEGFLPTRIPAIEMLVCPSQVSKGIPEEFDDGSYFYTGYVLAVRGFIPPSGWPFQGDMYYQVSYYPFENLLPVFSAFYDRQIASAGNFKERFVREGEIDVYRIREGVRHLYERTFDCVGDDIPDDVKIRLGSIPVLVEWPDIHASEKPGGHVLWLDGDVRWVAYPGRFPMTEEAMAIFTELAGRPPIGRLD